jgi:uncharacterized protein YggU (UPF0235/DUF167 family)
MARVAAPALDGRANAALIDALARAFNVRKSAVTIVAGAGHRTKIVEVNGIGSAAVHALMRAPAPPS